MMLADDDDKKDDEAPEEAEGAEGEEGEGEDEEGKKKSPLLFIIIGAVAVLLIGGGAAAYFLGVFDTKPACVEQLDENGEPVLDENGEPVMDCPEEEAKEDGKEKDAEGEYGEAGGAAFVEIPPMIVNLSAEDGGSRFLRLSVQLELKNSADKAAIEAVMPRVIDQFQTYLRELRVSDLRGSAGIYRLQMELLWRVNQAAHPTEVKNVLFQEILVQ